MRWLQWRLNGCSLNNLYQAIQPATKSIYKGWEVTRKIPQEHPFLWIAQIAMEKSSQWFSDKQVLKEKTKCHKKNKINIVSNDKKYRKLIIHFN